MAGGLRSHGCGRVRRVCRVPSGGCYDFHGWEGRPTRANLGAVPAPRLRTGGHTGERFLPASAGYQEHAPARRSPPSFSRSPASEPGLVGFGLSGEFCESLHRNVIEDFPENRKPPEDGLAIRGSPKPGTIGEGCRDRRILQDVLSRKGVHSGLLPKNRIGFSGSPALAVTKRARKKSPTGLNAAAGALFHSRRIMISRPVINTVRSSAAGRFPKVNTLKTFSSIPKQPGNCSKKRHGRNPV